MATSWLSYRPNNEEGHQRLAAKLKELMGRQRPCPIHGSACHQGLFARNLYLGQRIPLAGVAHQNGTIRFGRDPKTSALDVNCKAHEVDNLYVVDGSFFPSSAARQSRPDHYGQRPACGRTTCWGGSHETAVDRTAGAARLRRVSRASA